MNDISEEQFLKTADTFDILLFKSKGAKAEAFRKKIDYKFGKYQSLSLKKTNFNLNRSRGHDSEV